MHAHVPKCQYDNNVSLIASGLEKKTLILPLILLLIFSLVESFHIHFSEVNYINVCFVYRLHIPHSWVHTERHGPIYSCNRHSVARLHFVHQVTVCIQHHGVWGLTWGHVLCNSYSKHIMQHLSVKIKEECTIQVTALLDDLILESPDPKQEHTRGP